MAATLVQKENTLKTASENVTAASAEVKTLCDKLDGQIKGQTGWGGTARVALDNLNIQWQEKQRHILKTLNDLAEALILTDQETKRLDDDVADLTGQMASKLNSI